MVRWAGDWAELGDLEHGAPAATMQLAGQRGLTPVIDVSVFNGGTGALLRAMDEAQVATYVRQAADFAERFQPPFMGLGIELNTLYETSPENFDSFVALFDQASKAVHAASPGTKVYATFQLEKMKGLRGGLFGGTNDPANAEWDLIARFPNADMVAFTTYPALVLKDPSEMSSDYYAEIRQHTSLPVLFTEIGWHSQTFDAGSPPAPVTEWASTPEEQLMFVDRFKQLTATLSPVADVWFALYDIHAAPVPFDSMGLLDDDGNARPALQSWTGAWPGG